MGRKGKKQTNGSKINPMDFLLPLIPYRNMLYIHISVKQYIGGIYRIGSVLVLPENRRNYSIYKCYLFSL